MKTRYLAGFVLGATLLVASEAWSAAAFINANVQRILSNSGAQFGGCMALVDFAPGSVGLNCPGRWISFSCSGDFASRQDAQKNFELVQLAFALGKPVALRVQDELTHNGWCFADQVVVRQ